MLSRNLALPVLPFWMARSFYAQLLMVLTVLANAAGIDLMGYLSAMGLGSTHDEVLANGDKFVSAWQQIAPVIFGIWAWAERRAPNYRLSVSSRSSLTALGIFAVALFVLTVPVRTVAATGDVVCLPAAFYRDQLKQHHHEVRVWSGLTEGYSVDLMMSPGGGWTLLMIDGTGKACNMTGGDVSFDLREGVGSKS